MPQLSLLTWNSTGEGGNRGADMVASVVDFNTWAAAQAPAHPPIQLVAIQEADQGVGSINQALQNSAPFQNNFVQPPKLVNEFDPSQTSRVIARCYLLSWMSQNHMPATERLVPVNIRPQYVDLGSDVGVQGYISGRIGRRQDKLDVSALSKNIRWPLYQHFNFVNNPGGPNIHFFTWHAPLPQGMLGENLAPYKVPVGQGKALAWGLDFFLESNFLTGIKNGLAAQDLIIMAGDLNIDQNQLTGPWLFPFFGGVSRGLCHILVRRQAGQAAPAITSFDYLANTYPPHALIAANISW